MVAHALDEHIINDRDNGSNAETGNAEGSTDGKGQPEDRYVKRVNCSGLQGQSPEIE
jgi:hypothetical protein